MLVSWEFLRLPVSDAPSLPPGELAAEGELSPLFA